jgi:hypothetical protein
MLKGKVVRLTLYQCTRDLVNMEVKEYLALQPDELADLDLGSLLICVTLSPGKDEDEFVATSCRLLEL